MEEIRSKGKITSKEYARLNKISMPTAVTDLSSMLKSGIIKRLVRQEAYTTFSVRPDFWQIF